MHEQPVSSKPTQTVAHHICFSALALLVLVLFWPAFKVIAALGLRDSSYLQIIAAPLLLIFLMYWERDRIFREIRWNLRFGGGSLSVPVAAYVVFLRIPSYGDGSDGSVPLILAVCALILAWMSAFIACYGLRSFVAAWFPFCCLVLMIPVPAPFMDQLTVGLQHGSAAVASRMLHLAGVPVFAQGTKLLLPGLQIEVAPECSGIRSCLALALLGLLASRLCLRSGWNRLLLVVCTVPIAIFKNAIRISVIASLGAYVNRAFLFGSVHRYGGLVFTPLSVVLVVVLLLALQKSETWVASNSRQ